MKKLFGVLLLSLLFVTGCNSNMNTPTGSVEKYLNKYQNLDGEVTAQLDKVISSDVSMNDEQKKNYKELMLNQYRNLSYKIVDETITNDTAEVEVEVEVLDYASSVGESRIYYKNHKDEFEDKDVKERDTEEKDTKEEKGDDGLVEEAGEAIDKVSSFIEYKIKNMKNVTNTSKETITFYLNKVDNEWVVEDLSDVDLQKLHGLYEG